MSSANNNNNNNNKIIFQYVKDKCNKIAKHIRDNKVDLINILTIYETYNVADDEINRTLDLLENIEENKEYFQGEKIKDIAVFLPSNQPLYAFFCFAIIPSFQSKKVHIRIPENMKFFFSDLTEKLSINKEFDNINLIKDTRKNFLNLVTGTVFNNETGKREPVVDAVIFTGKTKTAEKIKKLFHKNTLFIFNGSGHNPVVITEKANLDNAVRSIIRVQLYNQGQDCAAPNSILVHQDIYNKLIKKLKEKINNIKVGPYKDYSNTIGPITRVENLRNITDILIRNWKFISYTAEGMVNFKTKIVNPIIIEKPLKFGGNYIESFAPIFFIQKYTNDNELENYFNNEKYKKNMMYLIIFGENQKLLKKK